MPLNMQKMKKKIQAQQALCEHFGEILIIILGP
jgi:hypothetical protein